MEASLAGSYVGLRAEATLLASPSQLCWQILADAPAFSFMCLFSGQSQVLTGAPSVYESVTALTPAFLQSEGFMQ